MYYRILQLNKRIFEILGMYSFVYTALAIDITLHNTNFYQTKVENVPIYFQ